MGVICIVFIEEEDLFKIVSVLMSGEGVDFVCEMLGYFLVIV